MAPADYTNPGCFWQIFSILLGGLSGIPSPILNLLGTAADGERPGGSRDDDMRYITGS